MSANNSINIAVEDRFIIVKLWDEHSMLPLREMEGLADWMKLLPSSYKVLCDARDLRAATDEIGCSVSFDIIECVHLLEDCCPDIICYPDDKNYIEEVFGSATTILKVKPGPISLNYMPLDVTAFGYYWPGNDFILESDKERLRDIVKASPISISEWERLILYFPDDDLTKRYGGHFDRINTLLQAGLPHPELEADLASLRILDNHIARCSRNSLLTEYAIQFCRDNYVITPYHAHGVHSMEVRNELLLGRPGVVANRTSTLLHNDLAELQQILSTPDIKESAIQKYLEQHLAVFQALGYINVYPQVVLARDDGTSLRPDFILEPAGRDWCDILDIKIPQTRTVVGTRDRQTLAAHIHELTAQLREYSAYFEDERLAKRIEDVYGIKCYKPRLIGIVGRDPKTDDERQLRRLMTAYADVEVITFDQLLRLAQTRLLI